MTLLFFTCYSCLRVLAFYKSAQWRLRFSRRLACRSSKRQEHRWSRRAEAAWSRSLLPRSSCLFLLLFCLQSAAAQQSKKSELFVGGRPVSYETVSSPAQDSKLLVLLHGASGPEEQFYQSQAGYFADKGYTVFVLHYLDASPTKDASTQNYKAWSSALVTLVKILKIDEQYAGKPIFVVGYSLGASVALAAGSQGLPVNAIAEWYGSLPDYFFENFKSMPPLLILHGSLDTNIPVLNANQLIRLCDLRHLVCENHIYPDQGHGFTGKSLLDSEDRTLAFFRDR